MHCGTARAACVDVLCAMLTALRNFRTRELGKCFASSVISSVIALGKHANGRERTKPNDRIRKLLNLDRCVSSTEGACLYWGFLKLAEGLPLSPPTFALSNFRELLVRLSAQREGGRLAGHVSSRTRAKVVRRSAERVNGRQPALKVVPNSLPHLLQFEASGNHPSRTSQNLSRAWRVSWLTSAHSGTTINKHEAILAVVHA